MAEQERSPLLTQQDPMLASSSSKEDQSLEASHENVHLLESETALLLEEFSEKSVKFKVKLDITGKGDSYEISDALNRIYTSTDRSITFDIVYKPEHGSNPRVRIMLVGSNLLHHPLARCSYHRKGDNTTFKDHVVRHKDASAEYVGTATGMLYPERLAILVPLDQSGLKSISLDFVCLNSCHKIRKLKLALVFTLEDQDDKKNVGRQIFHLQVSKNFKRDMEVAEKGPPLKRPATELPDDTASPNKQSHREQSTSPQPSSSRIPAGRSTEERPDSIAMNLNLPHSAAQEFLQYSRQFFEAKLYRANEQEKHELLPCLDKICKVLDALPDLKSEGKKDEH
ncbi:uncharacterized protein LOC120423566 [Culex pipiens pallens]|uniref:uncharacterized protein LOC120423566 n=1 Tax=Culex pipiens pallens TaxID=42434 RepID=UPI0019546358|nr:uncharacterized protein LOC120423566 [Culex pipiens pallens]XP_052562145.1 uncharacterized protein LOC120423566 [Culex pipiens pallens]